MNLKENLDNKDNVNETKENIEDIDQRKLAKSLQLLINNSLSREVKDSNDNKKIDPRSKKK